MSSVLLRLGSFVLAIQLAAAPLLAQGVLSRADTQRHEQRQNTLSANQAKDHVGEKATVCGTVASSRYAASSHGQPTFLNLERPYPIAVFTVVIWGSARATFSEAPEVAYRDKKICVTGVISLYRGTPQTVVSTPGMIAVDNKMNQPRN